MTRPDLDTILQELHSLTGLQPQRNGNRWKCRCPAHDDRNPSLSVWQDDEGKLGLKCYAGCETRAVVESLGFTMQQVFGGRNSDNGDRRTGTRRTRQSASAEK